MLFSRGCIHIAPLSLLTVWRWRHLNGVCGVTLTEETLQGQPTYRILRLGVSFFPGSATSDEFYEFCNLIGSAP